MRDASAVECRSRVPLQRAPSSRMACGPLVGLTASNFGGKFFVQQPAVRPLPFSPAQQALRYAAFLRSPRRHPSTSRSREFAQALRCYDAAVESAAAAAAAHLIWQITHHLRAQKRPRRIISAKSPTNPKIHSSGLPHLPTQCRICN